MVGLAYSDLPDDYQGQKKITNILDRLQLDGSEARRQGPRTPNLGKTSCRNWGQDRLSNTELEELHNRGETIELITVVPSTSCDRAHCNI